ncbi:DNA gyrase subunit B [bacterium HR07]|nr:DNA gyrase subunit B [bacterium HR07]
MVERTQNTSTTATATVSQYGAEQIKVLEDLEAVRMRPGMYIGGTGQDGLMHLIWEIVDNAVDEHLAGACTEIKVTVHEDNRITVADNGRGIPTEIHPEAGINTVELVYTKLHAGGKFDTGSYKVSGGLHGVGASVVNALSEFLEVEVRRNGKRYYQKFQRGQKVCDLHVVGEATDTGTTVTFLPDRQIFGEIKYDFARLAHRLKELAYLNPGLSIYLDNRITGIQRHFQSEGGIAAYVKELNEGRKPLHDDVIYFKDENGASGFVLEVAMQFTDEYDENIHSFANIINTKEGGTHLMGFKTALTRVFNEYGREKKIIPQDAENLDGRDVREGLTAIVSVKLRNPQFEGQTKTKLGNPDVQERVSNIVREQLELYFNNNPGTARVLLEKALRAQEARLAAKKAKQLVRRKGLLSSTALPGKLADCAEKDPAKCELYIVEGDSAGGSAKQGRNREFQAILPLRGKVLNVEKAALNKLLDNKELNALITALGTGIREEFDIERLRYHKIILMCDADIDGAHIRTLLLTFLFRNLRQLIEKGHVYIAKPPLYQIKKGRQVLYLYSDEELNALRSQDGKDGHFEVKRYKGLGEMNPEELWETTMNPEKRILKQVDINDALQAEELFKVLMGSEVGPRRDFILENSDMITNLDI